MNRLLLSDTLEKEYIAFIYRRLKDIGREVLIEKTGIHIELYPLSDSGQTYKRVADKSLKSLIQTLDEDSFKRIIHDGTSRTARNIANWYEDELFKDQRKAFDSFTNTLLKHHESLPLMLITISDAIWVKYEFDTRSYESLVRRYFTDPLYTDSLLMTIGQKEKVTGDMSLVRRMVRDLKPRFRGVVFVKRVDRSSCDRPWIDHVDAAFSLSMNANNHIVVTTNKFKPDPKFAELPPWNVPLSPDEVFT